MTGLTERGEKQFLAIEDGVRESTQSWREVLLDLQARGLEEGLQVAVGDGASGFWAAVEEVVPTTRHQRCWVHKPVLSGAEGTANVLNYLPRTVQPKAKAARHDIWMAPTRTEAERAFASRVETSEATYPKATQCVRQDREVLLTFYDFPAEHWVHLRTTNPIESTLGTIHHRTDRAKGCVTRDTMLAFAYQRAMCAERRWKRVRGLRQLGQVVQGVQFYDGIAVERPAGVAA